MNLMFSFFNPQSKKTIVVVVEIMRTGAVVRAKIDGISMKIYKSRKRKYFWADVGAILDSFQKKGYWIVDIEVER